MISLEWPSAQHERGLQMWGVKKAWEHVDHRLVPSQTVVPAVITNRARLEGMAVRGPQPERSEEALAYVPETGRESAAQMAAARGRWWELCHPCMHRWGAQTRTDMALESVQQLEAEGHCPQAHYAVHALFW